MLRTWLSTVRSAMNRRAPICLLLKAFGDQAGDLYTLQVRLVLTPLRLLHGHHSSALTTQQLQPLA
jgi:hypothetical protein